MSASAFDSLVFNRILTAVTVLTFVAVRWIVSVTTLVEVPVPKV